MMRKTKKVRFKFLTRLKDRLLLQKEEDIEWKDVTPVFTDFTLDADQIDWQTDDIKTLLIK